MSARLERDLLAAGQQVVRVPTKLMAQTRKSARSRGKSDPIDALAVARAVLRETDLPLPGRFTARWVCRCDRRRVAVVCSGSPGVWLTLRLPSSWGWR
ncbi:transposase [Mycobacterium tuberculosis]|nr:transposase [Mycobacterium tuberculosis]